MKTKKIVAIVLLCVLGAGIVMTGVFAGMYFVHDEVESYRNVGYIMTSTIDSVDSLDDLPIKDLTHVIFGFVSVSNDDITPRLSEESGAALLKLSQYLKENQPQTKLMVSLGGNSFCTATRTAQNRAKVVDGLAVLKEKYGLQGFDVDWEYPCRNTNNDKHCMHDASDYAALMEDMRARFGGEADLSIALCGSVTFMNDIKMRRMSRTLDFVNVMTYDLGLHNHCGYTETAASMFNAYLGGFKKEQLNLGLPFYERCKDKAYDYIEFDELMEMERTGKISIKSLGDYCYAKLDGHRLSFDTREQLMRKVNLVKKRGYGGVFCWHVGCNMDGSLLHEANEILNG